MFLFNRSGTRGLPGAGRRRPAGPDPVRSERSAQRRPVAADFRARAQARAAAQPSPAPASAAPALWAVPSHSGQPFQIRFIPIATCSTSATATRDRRGPRRRIRSARAARRPRPPAAQHDRRHVGAEPVRVMDRDARRRVEHAAFIVDSEPAPQDEGVPEVHRRPLAALAGRKIRAGRGRVVGAGPAAERDLHQQHRDPAMASRRTGRSAAFSSRRAGGSASHHSSASVSEPAEQVQRDDQRLQQQRHRPHAEQRLQRRAARPAPRAARAAAPGRGGSAPRARRGRSRAGRARRRCSGAPSR